MDLQGISRSVAGEHSFAPVTKAWIQRPVGQTARKVEDWITSISWVLVDVACVFAPLVVARENDGALLAGDELAFCSEAKSPRQQPVGGHYDNRAIAGLRQLNGER